MSIGQKLQMLRKKEGISQEQLAAKLGVSRQAISKWELDQSAPEIENIVKISEIFHVTTDYLMKDSSEEMQKSEDGHRTEVTNQQNRTLFLVCIGILVVGLFLSSVGWRTFQTEFAAGIGVILQIIVWIVFEVMHVKDNQGLRKKFYIAAVWLMLPFPLMFLSDILWSFYPISYSSLVEWAVTAVLYLFLCSIATVALKRKL